LSSRTPDAQASGAASKEEIGEANVIRLENVTVRRGATEVLHNLSIEIPAGRVTVVVGRSGAGKTTLIHLLNGLIAPQHGKIVLSDFGALDTPAAMKSHRGRTATIFQDYALIERLSAIDNVLLGMADVRNPLSLWPWPVDVRRQAAEALEKVGLLHRANTRVMRLSGGERQRVGIARALVRRPDLLLGDEPFSSIDLVLVRQLSAELRGAVARSGATIVIVLHQLETALALGDWVLGLADGQIAFNGPVEAFGSIEQARVFHQHLMEADHQVVNEEFKPCLMPYAA
jgi:phosphonate transport system ATP-binding protein